MTKLGFASGGVGSLAVRFAKFLDAQVVGTASGRDAALRVRRPGADLVMDVRSSSAVESLEKFAPNGLDAVPSLAGENSLEEGGILGTDAALSPGTSSDHPSTRSSKKLILRILLPAMSGAFCKYIGVFCQ